jgi:hypothetical protein
VQARIQANWGAAGFDCTAERHCGLQLLDHRRTRHVGTDDRHGLRALGGHGPRHGGDLSDNFSFAEVPVSEVAAMARAVAAEGAQAVAIVCTIATACAPSAATARAMAATSETGTSAKEKLSDRPQCAGSASSRPIPATCRPGSRRTGGRPGSTARPSGMAATSETGTSAKEKLSDRPQCRSAVQSNPAAPQFAWINMAGAAMVEELEAELGIPVFDSITVTLWAALRAAIVNRPTPQDEVQGEIERPDTPSEPEQPAPAGNPAALRAAGADPGRITGRGGLFRL